LKKKKYKTLNEHPKEELIFDQIPHTYIVVCIFFVSRANTLCTPR